MINRLLIQTTEVTAMDYVSPWIMSGQQLRKAAKELGIDDSGYNLRLKAHKVALCELVENEIERIRQEQEDVMIVDNEENMTTESEEIAVDNTPQSIARALLRPEQVVKTAANLPQETMKTLYIVRGCPGNGKTTLANHIAVCSIAADDYPGLYIDGVYQQHLQKESHQWCMSEVENLMQQNVSIAVHNTFTRIFYIKPYIELANKYGYSVHIIHSEAVLVNGGRTVDTHNVPLDVLTSMRNGWEPFNALPKLGITAKDIAQQIEKAKAYPDAIIFDMDGTIKRTKSGETFPQSPDDFEVTPEFDKFVNFGWVYDTPMYIVSNQRGLSGGQKTDDFLKQEWEKLEGCIAVNHEICFTGSYFASKEYVLHKNNTDLPFLVRFNGNYIKPLPAVFKLIHENSKRRNYWIVGDAHTDDRSEDWQFAQNCQKAHPELNIAYIPIELAAYVYQLHHT